MANIYLEHLQDKRLYAACYREIVEKDPTPQSFLLLGDAYMSIQEPERAMEVYEQALKRNPRDAILACRMGQSLIKTHQYQKAINYYKEAIKTGSSNQLRYDMAELQMRLKQYDKAEKTIALALKAESASGNDIDSMFFQAKLFNLLAKVHERAEDYESSFETLYEAKNLQVRVLKRSQVELPDTVPQQKQMASSICQKIAEYHANKREYELAINHYKEALTYEPENTSTLLSLAKLYMQMKELDQCQNTCMAILRMDKENDAATVMMADLSYRRNEYGTAIK
ncbi:Tetratricopeptide repeat protein 21B [Armadillidium vulgare]|nr:Tetratricopeptide repeat protein 21B [Armadillidium vulgare]